MTRRTVDLTLGVPTFNSAAYLDDLFASVTRQSVVPQCLLFCDNQSTDDTVARIERFRVANPDLYVRLHINDANLGVAGNYNRIIDHAFDTEWLQILDSDDYLLGEYYATLEPALTREADLVFTSMRSDSLAMNTATLLMENYLRTLRMRSVPRYLQVLGTACARSSLIYRTALLKQEKFIDPFFDGSDIIHVNLFMPRNVYWPKAQVYYRFHAASTTSALERTPERARLDHARYLAYVRTLPLAPRLFYGADFILRKKVGSLIRHK